MKVKGNQKTTLLILIFISILYFCVMIPANLTGAETPEMLEVFEVDEYAQYPHVIRMLTPGEGIYQTCRNFLIYLHYFYGYPFYFWSALSILPLKLFRSVWPDNTRVIVCVLRQMISVLPMILSACILVWITTKFKKPLLSIVLFLLILTMPAVLDNDFWWHPDSLTLLFLCLTFFFLDRDQMHCGENFLFAAFSCGAAIGTKYLGFYFALAIPAYLLSCLFAKQITLGKLFMKAGLFLLVMFGAVIVSDPLLLLPQERNEILGVMRQQAELSGTGIFLQYNNNFFENGHLPDWLTKNYMRFPWLLFTFFSLLAGLFSGKLQIRTISVVMLCYLITACIVNLNTAASRLHYYLPIILPLAACMPLAEEIFPLKFRKIAFYGIFLMIITQIGLNLPRDIEMMKIQLDREETSGSISLYHELKENYLPLPEIPAERMTRIYRDWKIYFPEQAGYAIKTDWELAAFPLIEDWHPDLILLEKENIQAYNAEGILEQAVSTEKMSEIAAFYSAAAEKNIPGYELLIENNFGMVFRKVQP